MALTDREEKVIPIKFSHIGAIFLMPFLSERENKDLPVTFAGQALHVEKGVRPAAYKNLRRREEQGHRTAKGEWNF